MPPKRRTKVVKVRSVDMSEVERIVLWRHPITTLKHFFLELISIFINYGRKLIDHFIITLLVAIAVATFYFLSITEGPHEAYVLFLKKQTFWWAYWVGLGILSSIGLGTGLHTFLLYLGPFIAQVTLAAYECDSVDFPAPPYPDEIVCPTSATSDEISIWTIVNKVRWEAVMWGAGTALGELPPYFMARTSRLSGTQSENEQEIQQLLEPSAEDMQSFVFRIKRLLYILIQKIGFFGILVCASIPNPLFDLAGITCGHFLVPFWTFFGATLIGKSVIKVHIQEFFTIFLFSEHHVEAFVQSLRHIPYVGTSLQVPFREWLVKQKQQLHRPVGSGVHQETSLLSMIFSLFVGAMILFFVVSIINSLAQRRYRAQLVDQEQEKVK